MPDEIDRLPKEFHERHHGKPGMVTTYMGVPLDQLSRRDLEAVAQALCSKVEMEMADKVRWMHRALG